MTTRPDGRPARGASQEQLVAAARRLLQRIAGDDVAGSMPVEGFRDDSWIRVSLDHSEALLRALRDDPETRFEMLMDVTCVHLPKRPLPLGPFDVVYHLTSLSKGHRLRIKVACPEPDAGVPSAYPIWKGADFLEREAYDMFGVRFTGHPDLRRILMPEGYRGWPMRKEFPYRGY